MCGVVCVCVCVCVGGGGQRLIEKTSTSVLFRITSKGWVEGWSGVGGGGWGVGGHLNKTSARNLMKPAWR